MSVTPRNGKIDKEGYLVKQGKIVKSWKKRWFILSGTNLFYFKNKGDAEPAGVVSLPRSTVRTFPVHKGKRNVFEVVTNQNRSYFLQADDHVSMDEWMKVIERISQVGEDNAHHSQLPSVPIKKEEIVSIMHVKGMMCERCTVHVRKAVSKFPGVENIDVDFDEETITITGKVDLNEVQMALEEAGFVASIA